MVLKASFLLSKVRKFPSLPQPSTRVSLHFGWTNTTFSNYYDYLNTITAQQHNKVTAHQASARQPENSDPSCNFGTTMGLGSLSVENGNRKFCSGLPVPQDASWSPQWDLGKRSPLEHYLIVYLRVSVLWDHHAACLPGGSLFCGNLKCPMTLTTGFLEVRGTTFRT